jgi:hypothetical protein
MAFVGPNQFLVRGAYTTILEYHKETKRPLADSWKFSLEKKGKLMVTLSIGRKFSTFNFFFIPTERL